MISGKPAATNALAQLLVVSFVLLPSAQSQNSNSSPAYFSPGKESLLDVLEIPESPQRGDDRIYVLCHARIRDNGSVRDPLCLNDLSTRNHSRFRRAVLEALETATFEPARFGDANVEVFASFMVAFECDDAKCDAIAAMHWGQHVDRFGMNYILPQDVVTEFDWFEEYGARTGVFERPDRRIFDSGYRTLTNNSREVTRNRSVACSDCSEGFGFRVSLLVDAQGQSSDPEIESIGYAGRRWAKIGRDAMAKSTFIPGVVDGKPQPMRHSLFMYYFRDQVNN